MTMIIIILNIQFNPLNKFIVCKVKKQNTTINKKIRILNNCFSVCYILSDNIFLLNSPAELLIFTSNIFSILYLNKFLYIICLIIQTIFKENKVMKRKLPSSLFNPISLMGILISLVSFLAIIILFFANMVLAPDNPYFGIITYLVFPIFLLIGLLIIPVGMYFERWRRLRRKEVKERRLPNIDFNLAEHRNGFLIFLVISIVFIIMSAVGGYQAYNFTDSVAFCGKICHAIMQPEYEAYLDSPHARVSCAECHVGTGANWYVKSKLSGAYQVYAAIADKYPRPIPTPIKNLRPAQETCEHCHWPKQFL